MRMGKSCMQTSACAWYNAPQAGARQFQRPGQYWRVCVSTPKHLIFQGVCAGCRVWREAWVNEGDGTGSVPEATQRADQARVKGNVCA